VEEKVSKILEQANVKPDFDYYVQLGGSASGPLYRRDQLDQNIMSGAGAVEIFDRGKRGFLEFIRRLGNFYQREFCGKCRGKEFATELQQLISSLESERQAQDNIKNMETLIDGMHKKTFCGLCKSLREPFVSYCRNLLNLEMA
jgi:NADH:ubiquinone oxidoreductase subunit F (NADH-binding)